MTGRFMSIPVARRRPVRGEIAGRVFGCGYLMGALALAHGCASVPKTKPVPERRTQEQAGSAKYKAATRLGEDGTLIVEVTETATCEVQVRSEDGWQTERLEPCGHPAEGFDL